MTRAEATATGIYFAADEVGEDGVLRSVMSGEPLTEGYLKRRTEQRAASMQRRAARAPGGRSRAVGVFSFPLGGRCCDRADVDRSAGCVCAYVVTCPVHGVRHVGSHD